MDSGLCAYPNEQCKKHGACVIAEGTNMGLWKSTDISMIDHASLMVTARNYLKIELIKTTHDTIHKGAVT